jgi:dTDP-4-dehydrorhamnose 3,5-epimerase
MIFHTTTLQDACLIELEPRGDARGAFARTMCRDEFAAHGLVTAYAQQNLSVSVLAGTLRGLHFQRSPHAEAKLIRCVRGAVHDVILDLRSGSPSYMRHEAFELSATNGRQLYVPPGFAHGFQTLVDDVEMTYLISEPYTPSAEGGLRHDDARLGIAWPLPVAVLSDRDAGWPLLQAGDPPIF